jgi:hypothetical protein
VTAHSTGGWIRVDLRRLLVAFMDEAVSGDDLLMRLGRNALSVRADYLLMKMKGKKDKGSRLDGGLASFLGRSICSEFTAVLRSFPPHPVVLL